MRVSSRKEIHETARRMSDEDPPQGLLLHEAAISSRSFAWSISCSRFPAAWLSCWVDGAIYPGIPADDLAGGGLPATRIGLSSTSTSLLPLHARSLVRLSTDCTIDEFHKQDISARSWRLVANALSCTEKLALVCFSRKVFALARKHMVGNGLTAKKRFWWVLTHDSIQHYSRGGFKYTVHLSCTT